MTIDRRTFATVLPAALLAGRAARAATVTDGAGRAVPVPAKVERVFPAGPPAAIMLYTLAPELLLGWPRANRPEEREFLLPDIGARPEVGRITGRGNTANLEVVLALKPDLILDVGSTSATYVSLAERVQQQTGIPYALLDGRFDGTAAAYRTLGALIGRAREGRGLRAHRRRHDARRSRSASPPCRASAGRASTTRAARAGSRPGSGGSINVETIELLAQKRGRRDARRARHRLDRAGAAVEPGRDRHHRSRFRRRTSTAIRPGRRSRRCANAACISRPSCRSAGSIFRPA